MPISFAATRAVFRAFPGNAELAFCGRGASAKIALPIAISCLGRARAAIDDEADGEIDEDRGKSRAPCAQSRMDDRPHVMSSLADIRDPVWPPVAAVATTAVWGRW
jgi:hypothetical protein